MPENTTTLTDRVCAALQSDNGICQWRHTRDGGLARQRYYARRRGRRIAAAVAEEPLHDHTCDGKLSQQRSHWHRCAATGGVVREAGAKSGRSSELAETCCSSGRSTSEWLCKRPLSTSLLLYLPSFSPRGRLVCPTSAILYISSLASRVLCFSLLLFILPLSLSSS